MAIIRKKCWPKWFKMFISGKRKFELRLADFNLKTGDTLVFEEYDPKTKAYTGKVARFRCRRVERSAKDPLQFYKVKEVRKHGFWIIDLEKER